MSESQTFTTATDIINIVAAAFPGQTSRLTARGPLCVHTGDDRLYDVVVTLRGDDEPNYESALLEIRSALSSLHFAAPEMMSTHIGRISRALVSVGIDPYD